MTIPELYELFIHNPKVTTDSRNCPRGSIFFALKGDKFDGNQYAEKALASGCVYAVIDNPDYFIGERTILVDNVLTTLQQLAHRHRKVIGCPIIGITGTNGKTTTKELLASVLSTKYNLLYTEGNLNNDIGVPLTLLRLTHDHEMAVIEMGASHPGDIKELVDIAQPNYGIITNVGRAHLEGFGSFEGVIKTKGELYDYMRRTKGKIFINQDNKYLKEIANGIEQVTYGSDETAFAWGCVVSCNPYLTFELKQQGKIHTVETHLIGNYNLDNALVAVAVYACSDSDADKAKKAAESKAAAEAQAVADAACLTDLQCIGDKGTITAGIKCPSQIEKLAKGAVKWTDGTLEPKFSRFRWKDKTAGVVTHIGDKAQFQNGFGAFINVVYTCDLDMRNSGEVVHVGVSEGRL